MNTQNQEQSLAAKYLLSVNETARWLGCSRCHIYTLIREESLPAVRMRHRWAFRQPDLEAWIAARPAINRIQR